MHSESFLQLAQFGTIVIGLLSVAVTLRSHRRQMHAEMFIEFSSRFHHMLGSLPAETWMPNDGCAQPLPPPSGDLTKSCLQCFHIMASLYFLHKGGYICPELWRPWQRGIKRTMQGQLLRREWFAVEAAFGHNVDFCRYMHGLMKS